MKEVFFSVHKLCFEPGTFSTVARASEQALSEKIEGISILKLIEITLNAVDGKILKAFNPGLS